MADEIRLQAPKVEQQVVVNISGEAKLEKFASTLDKISKGRGLQKYWKDQQTLINDTIKAYNNFNKSTSQTDATELIKTTNALKAMAGVDISTIIPDFDKFTSVLSKAESMAGHLTDAFSVNSFKDAFSSFETLKAYGLDLDNFFQHFELDINVSNLQETVRNIERELRRTKRELFETQDELQSKKIELNSFIDGSGLTEQMEKLRYLEDEIRYVREQASEEFRTFLKGNDFSGWDLDENGAFEKYFNEIRDGSLTAKEAIANFKSEYAYLLQDKFSESGGLFNLQQVQEFESKLESVLTRVEEISRQMNDIIENGVITKAMQNLSVDDSVSQSQRDLFANVLKDEEALSSVASVLKKIIDESITLQNVNNNTFNEEQFNKLLILFEKIESSLSSMKSVFVDVGDGEEFSPLLKMINEVQSSITKLNTSIKGIGLNMNIDIGSDNELEAKFQEKSAKALNAYKRLFEHIKMSGAGDASTSGAFFDFNLDDYDTAYQKAKAIADFIERQRADTKKSYNGYDVLKENTEVKYWNQASAAMGQATKVLNEMKATSDTSPLENLFGKTDLTEVVSQLSLIVDKLGEISASASEFKNIFANGFNVSASVEEIEKLTNRVKELEDKLSKINVPTSTSTTQIKDTLQGNTKASAESSAHVVKDEASAMEQVAENAEKASNGKEKFAKANKKVKESADASANSIDKETSSLDEKEWDKNVKVIQKYMDANTELNNLKAKDKGTGKYASEIAYQTKEVEKLEKVAIEARATLSSMINPHETPIDDWNKWLEMMKQFDQATKGSTKSVAKLEDALRNMAESQSNKMYSVLDTHQKNLNNLKPSEGNRSSDFNKVVNDYDKEVQTLRTFIESLDKSIPLTKEQTEEFDKLVKKVKDAKTLVDSIPKSQRGSDEDSRTKEIDKLTKYLEKNTKISKEARLELKKYLELLKSNDPSVNVKELHTAWTNVAIAEREAGREGRGFFDIISNKAIYGAAARFAGYYLSFTDIIRYAKEGFETIKEYDKALTEMNKVSDESIQTLKEFQNESFELADSIGTTASQIQNSTADWMRLGESLEEAKKSAQDANILFNVSEFGSIDEATESLVSMSQAYKELEKGEIIDVVNNLGNNFAISTDGLATALQNSASALKTAQNDFFEAAALTTAANTVVQDPDKVGAGLRTIALRLTGTEAAREELSALGEDVDDFVVTTTSKMDQQIRDLTKTQGNFGVSLLDMNGNYRSTYDVLLDIAKVWDKIAEEDLVTGENRQNALLEMMAGKNRSNILASILQSPDVLEEAYAYALDSEGSALKENEAYLESIQGHLDRLKNSWDNLWINENNREVITFFLDLAKSVLDAANEFGALNTLLVGGGGIFAAIKAFKGDGRLKKSSLIFM